MFPDVGFHYYNMYVRTPSSEAEINQSPDYGGVNNLGLAIELDSNAEAFNFDEPCDNTGWPGKVYD